jgi:hypothetical protein
MDPAYGEKFIELADRTPESTADAEYLYMKMLRDDAEKAY